MSVVCGVTLNTNIHINAYQAVVGKKVPDAKKTL